MAYKVPYINDEGLFPADLEERLAAPLLTKADLVGGKVVESQIPDRLSDTALSATIGDQAPFVDMLAEGATANGVADDWAKFTAARTKAGSGGTVHFPARKGAATTTYYMAGSRPDLSGTHISADPSVVLKFTDSNPNMKTWGLLTPVTVENLTHDTVSRKSDGIDSGELAKIAAANVQPQPATIKAHDLTTWTPLGVAAGGFAPYTVGTPSATITENSVSWGATFTNAFEGVTTPATVGEYYEFLGETTGTNAAAWIGAAFLSADNHLVIGHMTVGGGNFQVIGSTAFAAGGTRVIDSERHKLVSTFGGLVFGVKLRTARRADIYLNGKFVYTITFLKDVTAIGAITNATDSTLKTFSEFVTYGTEYEPYNSRRISVSTIGDSITYGAWTPTTWPDLLPISLHGLPGGGGVAVRQNLAVSGTTAVQWATASGPYDIAAKSFVGDNYVCVMLGTNDGQSGTSKAAYVDALTTIANKIVADGAVPVFGMFPFWTLTALSGVTGVTTSNYNRASRIRAAVARFAAVNNYPLALVHHNWGENDAWLGDNIHPEAIGQAAVAKAFAQAIARHNQPV